MLQEFIAQETARLQAIFDRMNAEGARITVFNEDGSRLFGDLVDSLRVTRIAPFFDAQATLPGPTSGCSGKPSVMTRGSNMPTRSRS